MNTKLNNDYPNNVITLNEPLNLELISRIEKECRQQRSEAIFQAFASLVKRLRTLPESIARLANMKSCEHIGNKNASASLSIGRFNLHTK